MEEIYDELINISKAAKLLGVHPDTLMIWDKSGKLVALRTLGNHRRYKLSEIYKILEKKYDKRNTR